MRLGLTQRVIIDARYGERRDALDQRWMAFAAALGITPVVLPNAVAAPEAYVASLQLDGAILTGGNNIDAPAGAPDAAPERDRLERVLLDHCAGHRLPVVGVCRGYQMLQCHAGGPLAPVTGHAGTRHTLAWSDDVPADLRAEEVNSYHDFAIAAGTLSQDYRALAHAPDGTVEAVAHHDLPWLGIMWHPEREASPRDVDLRLLGRVLEGTLV